MATTDREARAIMNGSIASEPNSERKFRMEFAREWLTNSEFRQFAPEVSRAAAPGAPRKA